MIVKNFSIFYKNYTINKTFIKNPLKIFQLRLSSPKNLSEFYIFKEKKQKKLSQHHAETSHRGPILREKLRNPKNTQINRYQLNPNPVTSNTTNQSSYTIYNHRSLPKSFSINYYFAALN